MSSSSSFTSFFLSRVHNSILETTTLQRYYNIIILILLILLLLFNSFRNEAPVQISCKHVIGPISHLSSCHHIRRDLGVVEILVAAVFAVQIALLSWVLGKAFLEPFGVACPIL